MEFYIISPFFCAIFAFLLGILVLSKNFKSPINRSFALLCFETSHWQICWFISYYFTTPAQKDFIVRLAFMVILFIPFTYYHFIVQFLRVKKEILWSKVFYFISLIWLILIWTTKWFIVGYQQFWWGYYPKAGFLYFFYLGIAVVAIVRTLILLSSVSYDGSISANIRNQNKFVLLASWFYCFASIEYLIDYGVAIYPIGVFFILCSFAIIAYAILKYHLMEIKVAIARASILVLVYTFILGLPFWFAFKTGLWGWGIALMAVSATSGPFIFSYLRKRTEDILLAEQIRYQKEIKEFSSTLIYIKDSNELTERVVTKILESIKLTFAGIYLKGEGNYYLAGFRTNDSYKLPLKIELNSDFVRLLKETTNPILGEYLPKMERVNIGVGAPLLLNNDLGGFIILGNKQEGIFTNADIDMLSILSSQTSLALAEIHYFNAYQKATEEKHKIEIERSRLESAFQISEAYRHELGNIINIITLASASLMGGGDYEITKEDITEASAAIYNSTQRANNIFNAIKNYNEKAKEEFREIDMSVVVEEQINSHREIVKEKSIELKTEVEKGIKISANKNLAYAVKYLIEGAIRAIEYYKPKEREIIIDLRKDKEKVELEITDTGGDVLGDNIYKGVGIERGKEGGIIYFIARRIIFDHSGKLKIESHKEGVGARFIIAIPLKKGEKE